MLHRLHIRNYAIINELSIDFNAGLNVITGETGAGKSILMGALSLILGERADSASLKNKETKCIVEAEFSVEQTAELKNFFELHELDMHEEIIVRREIASSGKSRSFINDSPVNLSQLKNLSTFLVDLHQQFDTLELGDAGFQRKVLDAVAVTSAEGEKMKTAFIAFAKVQRELKALQEVQELAARDKDYNQFLFNELDEFGLEPNALEDLAEEFKLLSNGADIKLQLVQIQEQLKDGEQPALQEIKSALQKLKAVAQYQRELPNLVERTQSALLELEDITDELERIEGSISTDEERMLVVSEKIDAGYKLFKKHGVQTTAELISIKNSLEAVLMKVADAGYKSQELELQLKQMQQTCESIAAKLSAARKKEAPALAKKIDDLLKQVGMPNARLQIRVNDAPLSETGSDEIVFLFDANNSGRFEQLRKVASGGELSRLMLSVKSLVAQKLELPTLIFDEIDTGISGEAARRVGQIMKGMAAAHQLIVISHQPQIAAKADAHLYVYKAKMGTEVNTSIRHLGKEESMNAIAQMMGGEQPSAAVLQSAREMMTS